MIKKAFFDMWDNLFHIILLNLGFIAVAAVPILLPSTLVNISSPLAIVTLVIGIILVFLYLGAAAKITSEIADYNHPGFKDFFRYLKESWKSSAVLAVVVLLHVFILFIAVPVYGSMGSIIGLVAIMFLLWASIAWLLASQYYLPIRSRLDQRIGKIFRKSFILLLDNTFFTIFMAIFAIITLVLSSFTAFLLPGVASILLLWNVGLKLRLYKYDYLEEHPEANRKKIPWDALLIDDRDRVGKRTLRGMIFPWKE